MVRPSSCPIATDSTQSVWPVNGWPAGVPVAASHTRTVLSPLPEATTVWPFSCPIATAYTGPVWPVSLLAHRVAGGRVP